MITVDAMGCQKAIAKKVVSKEADYLLLVKSNQPSLEAAFDNYFKLEMLQRGDGDTYSAKEQRHSRVETRLCLVNDDLSVLGDIAFE
ncbi:ISAs1 family transposase [Oceanisphaera sp. DM8]|uniref:ISAs1 family transposase n=1 Tax=Oceanisphaera pacifica TaxID=2818389 RepID=A0ABS3NGM8_9GAMM|nr:ISAs1 family transposase [Oceanisphaera pacifica]